MAVVKSNGKFVGLHLTCPVCGCAFTTDADDRPDMLIGHDGTGVLAVLFECPQCWAPCSVPDAVVRSKRSVNVNVDLNHAAIVDDVVHTVVNSMNAAVDRARVDVR